MISKQSPVDLMNGYCAFVSPVQCLSDIVQAWTEYLRMAEEEKTKRLELKAWEKVNLTEIKAKHNFLIGYLEHSFDERAQNFQLLFQVVDRAMLSSDNQQLGLALHAIVELAKSSPFQNLSHLSTVKAALNDRDHVWEF